MNYLYFSNICIFAICFTSNTYPEMRPLGSIPIQCIVQQLQPVEQVIQYLSTFYPNHRTFFSRTFFTSQFFLFLSFSTLFFISILFSDLVFFCFSYFVCLFIYLFIFYVRRAFAKYFLISNIIVMKLNGISLN